MRRRSWGGFPAYVPVARRREKAAAQAARLGKKLGGLQPVLPGPGRLAASWWGRMWNANLERYADYANRIGRGRSYLRNGSVLDLRMEAGLVRALVAGSRPSPYQISIVFEPLSKEDGERLSAAVAGKIESAAALLAGNFPEAMQETFFTPHGGLFPAPSAIHFTCTCPDVAVMCKHVAAVLYGVGARLDHDPGLFFTLRGLEVAAFAGRAAQTEARRLLDKAPAPGGRIMRLDGAAGERLSALFGVRMEEALPAPGKSGAKRKSRRKS